MIRGWQNKGLRKFFETGSKAGIQPEHADRLRLILNRLDHAREPRDMDLPGLDLHELQGRRAGTYAVTVRANWRITFAFEGPDAVQVDYEDYH